MPGPCNVAVDQAYDVTKPIVHYGGAGWPIFEYALPVAAGRLLPEHRRCLSTWMAKFCSISPSQARARLSEEWRVMASESGVMLREHLEDYRVASLMIQHERNEVCPPWLRLVSDSSGRSILVRGPQALSREKAEFVSTFQSDSAEDFCVYFRGAHAYRGHETAYPDHSQLDFQPMSYFGILEGLNEGEFSNAMPVFVPGNGDIFLLGSGGHIGRWLHEDNGTVAIVFDSLRDFTVAFIALLCSRNSEEKRKTWLG